MQLSWRRVVSASCSAEDMVSTDVWRDDSRFNGTKLFCGVVKTELYHTRYGRRCARRHWCGPAPSQGLQTRRCASLDSSVFRLWPVDPQLSEIATSYQSVGVSKCFQVKASWAMNKCQLRMEISYKARSSPAGQAPLGIRRTHRFLNSLWSNKISPKSDTWKGS